MDQTFHLQHEQNKFTYFGSAIPPVKEISLPPSLTSLRSITISWASKFKSVDLSLTCFPFAHHDLCHATAGRGHLLAEQKLQSSAVESWVCRLRACPHSRGRITQGPQGHGPHAVEIPGSRPSACPPHLLSGITALFSLFLLVPS